MKVWYFSSYLTTDNTMNKHISHREKRKNLVMCLTCLILPQEEVVHEMVEMFFPDVFLLLSPTSPF